MEGFDGLAWMIGGEAGWGINLSAEILGKALIRHGFYVFGNIEYESLIRGGHSYYKVRFSNNPIYSHVDYVDVLLALDDKTIIGDGIHTFGHINELRENSILIYDEDKSNLNDKVYKALEDAGVRIADLPMTRIVKEETQPGERLNIIMRNSVGLGATAYVFNLKLDFFRAILFERFGPERGEVAHKNMILIERGYNYFSDNYPDLNLKIKPRRTRKKLGIANGNYMAALGSIKAGVKFWVQYPMTPATPIYEYMNGFKDKYNIIVLQPESEISAICMAIGASYAGARAGVGTSGGGFALMTEAITFASMAEVPIVIFEVSRSSPSTGIPTKTEQGDLFQVLYPGQGFNPKAVILPGDPVEIYYFSQLAYNIAERYQMPVIIHYDKHLADSLYTFEIPYDIEIRVDRGSLIKRSGSRGKPFFKRYKITENGISYRPMLGTKDVTYITTSLEHDEYGIVTEREDIRVKMEDKRIRKYESLREEIRRKSDTYHPIKIYGRKNAPIAIVGWGSTKGVIIDALRYFNNHGENRLKYIQVLWAAPFPDKEFIKAIEDVSMKIIVENNSVGMMEQLIMKETCIRMDYNIRKYDGRPFSLNYLVEKLTEVIRGGKG